MAILESHERIGTILDGRYEVVRILGEGGMGVVFEGREARLTRRVAIKLLHPHLSSNAEIRARFVREAQAAATLDHENVVRIYAIGDLPDGASYIVMEYLDGESLSALLGRRHRLAPHELLELIGPAMDAVAHAHAAGIVHRDLKPENVFLARTSSGVKPKVVDFGIAKVADKGQMTATNSMLGTPLYMAPEQIEGSKTVGPAADVWSMGVLVYQALSGTFPFEIAGVESSLAMIARIMVEPVTPLETRLPNVSRGLADVVNRALAKRTSERYANMGSFHADLARVIRALPPDAEDQERVEIGFAATKLTPPESNPVPRGAQRTPALAEVPKPLRVLVRSRRLLVVAVLVGAAAVATLVGLLRMDRSSPEASAIDGASTRPGVRARAPVTAPPGADVGASTNVTPPASATPLPGALVGVEVHEPTSLTDAGPARLEGTPGRAVVLPARRDTIARPSTGRAASTTTAHTTRNDGHAQMDAPPVAAPTPIAACFRDLGNGVRVRVPCP